MTSSSPIQLGPNEARAWAFGAMFVLLGILSVVLDYLGWPTSPHIWLGFLDLFLGLGVATLAVIVARGHNPAALRIGVVFLAAFVVVFFASLFLVALHAWR